MQIKKKSFAIEKLFLLVYRKKSHHQIDKLLLFISLLFAQNFNFLSTNMVNLCVKICERSQKIQVTTRNMFKLQLNCEKFSFLFYCISLTRFSTLGVLMVICKPHASDDVLLFLFFGGIFIHLNVYFVFLLKRACIVYYSDYLCLLYVLPTYS